MPSKKGMKATHSVTKALVDMLKARPPRAAWTRTRLNRADWQSDPIANADLAYSISGLPLS
jgi:hypothetical protein